MDAFNEIYEDSGEKRPAYVHFETRTGIDLIRIGKQLGSRLSIARGADRAIIHPIPLVLDEKEYREVLIPGVLQRAFALQGLFRDLALGSGRCVQAGLLTHEDLDHLLQSEGITLEALRRCWRGQDPEQIRFVYAPDLARDPQGRWQVIEDNVGCVGGVAEGRSVLKTFLQVSGIRAHREDQLKPDLTTALVAFLARVGLSPGASNLYGIPGPSLADCPGPDSLFETEWKSEQLNSLGIHTIQPEEILERAIQPAALINLSATLVPSIQRLAKAIFVRRAMPVLGAPAVGLVGSKGFLAWGNELTAFYLNEPALLTTPRTQLLRRAPNDLPAKGVLKRCSGCGGAEVYFLADAPDRQAILDTLKSWGPGGGVLQEYVTRSILEVSGIPSGMRAFVEIRPIVYVTGWKSAIADDVVSGRAVLAAANPVGEICREARRLAVIREGTATPPAFRPAQ